MYVLHGMGRNKDTDLALLKERLASYGEIYVITCTANGKQYVGQAQLLTGKDRRYNASKGRWNTHLSDAKTHNHCTYLNHAIRKYGTDAFEVLPLLTCKIEDMTKFEDAYIHELRTMAPNGYNLRAAGRCGRASDETRKKMSESKCGSRHFQFGKHRTDEEKEKIRQTNINNAVRYDHNGVRLPKYLKYVQWSSENGYHVVSHPLCKLRKFVTTKSGTWSQLEENKARALEYLELLNEQQLG